MDIRGIRKLMAFCLLTMALCVSLESVAKRTEKVKNTFETPDFAFPATVADNAAKELRKAGNSRPADRFRAAIQIVLARNTISSEVFTEIAAMVDSLAQISQTPYRELYYSVEAQMYQNLYLADRWTYDDRLLPMTSVPADPKAWSKGIFTAKVDSLLRLSIADKEKLRAIPITDINTLLKKSSNSRIYFPTVYDFLAVRASDISSSFRSEGNTIPFTAKAVRSDKSLNSQIIEDQIAYYKQQRDVAPLTYYVIQEASLKSRDEAFKYLLEEYSGYSSSPYTLAILSSAYNYLPTNSEDIKHYYSILQNAISQHPDAPATKSLKSILEMMGRKNVGLRFPSQILPGESLEVKASVNNLNSVKILVFKKSNNFSSVYDSFLKRKKYSLTAADIKSIIKNNTKYAGCHDVTVTGTEPFSEEVSLVLPGMETGDYLLVPSLTASLEEALPDGLQNAVTSPLKVASMQIFSSNLQNEKSSGRIYVVDGKNQRPLEDIAVTISKRDYRSSIQTTNKDGFIIPPFDSFTAEVKDGDTSLRKDFYFGYYNNAKPDTVRAVVLTDLSIYRPGDKVGFVCIAYNPSGTSILPDRELNITFSDANGKEIASRQVVTDEYGRASGEFTVPASGLLGQFSITSKYGDKYAGSAYFNVAEYVAPKFFVEIEGVDNKEYKIGDVVNIKGKAMTYSGVPVSNADVSYSISTFNWFWRWNVPANGIYGGTTKTTADGSFIISLPTAGLENTPYARSGYRLVATVTDSSGESEASSPLNFTLDSSYEISASLPSKINAADFNGKVNVEVRDIVGKSISQDMEYLLTYTADKREVASGKFVSPLLSIGLADLPSGKYSLTLKAIADPMSEKVYDFVLYRDDDKVPPYSTSLWIPDMKITASAEQKEVPVKIGSSFDDNYILCEVVDANGFLFRKWIKLDKGMTEIGIPIGNSEVKATFSAMRNLEPLTEIVTILPHSASENLKVEVSSFRSKLVPGTPEKWTFRYTYAGRNPGKIPAIAVMSDKSLDAIAPFSWSFTSLLNYRSASSANLSSRWISPQSFTCYDGKKIRFVNFSIPSCPSLEMYGYYSLMGGYRQNSITIRGRGGNAKYALKSESVVDEVYMTSAPMMNSMAVKESAVETDEADTGGSDASEEPALRPVECPLAFFRPMLLSDDEGNLDISFTVPDFNTTWKLQLLGYTNNVNSAMQTLEAVASKPVMVSSNLPRFVRTGDVVRFAVNLYNNTTESRPIAGKIKIIDPTDGRVLLDYNSGPCMVEAAGTKTVYVEYHIPSDEQMILFRSQAVSDNFSDGEESLISILPSSSPVFESAPYYLQPGEESFSMKLPEFEHDSKVTLQYSDNPVWYCIASLPDLVTDVSDNLFSVLYAYYGSVASAGIVKKYPAVRDALSSWSKASDMVNTPLVSRLETDSALKAYSLSETIWVNDAQSSDMRASRLSQLLEPEALKEAVSGLSERLSRLRSSDGGWSWCPGMESSLFITSSVVDVLGMLNNMGFLDSDEKAGKIADDAIKYCDSEWVKLYNRDRKNFSPESMLGYLYSRSSFPARSSVTGFASLRAKAIAEISKNWRSLGVYDAACAAVLLARNGKKTESAIILKSLEEKAMRSAKKGMWYDNLDFRNSSSTSLLITSKVLEAFSEVQPSSPCVDQLRQWLLLQKQVQDWGSDRNTAEVVFAILSSGTDWTASASAPEVSVDGIILSPAVKEMSTGTFTIQLDASEVSGKNLAIRRNAAGPAWGAVMSQYVAPMESVKAYSIPSISVTKEIYTLTESGTGTLATEGEIEIGQKVRVVITVKNSDNLDYLAICDERPACLQPSDQLSQYALVDGIYMYRQQRKSNTDFFISYLPKGTHTITYDCYVTRAGIYSCGIATAQSQYAPAVTAHSAGRELIVKQ